MKESTRIQIENMKNQTFGVEIEGNNITRQKAAKVAATYFGTGRYENTAGRNGTAPGRLGMRMGASGNSRRTFHRGPGRAENANWSPRS